MSEIKVVPCWECLAINKHQFCVQVGNSLVMGEIGAWCGTEAEALEKAAELQKQRDDEEYSRHMGTLTPAAPPVETRPPAPRSCGQIAGALHPRLGLFYGCVLTEGHEGDHKPGGNCFAHGKYIGHQCPRWPKCAEEVTNGVATTESTGVDSVEQAVPPRPLVVKCKHCHAPRKMHYGENCGLSHDQKFEPEDDSEVLPESEVILRFIAKGRHLPDCIVDDCHGKCAQRIAQDFFAAPAAIEQAREWSVATPEVMQYELHKLLTKIARAVAVPEPAAQQESERKYPCADCGVMRSQAEGGTTFTVCDECFDKRRQAEPAPTPSRVHPYLSADELVMRDACFSDMCGLLTQSAADLEDGITGKQALELLAKSISENGAEGFGVDQKMKAAAEASALGTKEE